MYHTGIAARKCKVLFIWVGHTGMIHDGHIDCLHDGHLHHVNGDKVEEHTLAVNKTNPADCTPKPACKGHEKGTTTGRTAATPPSPTATTSTTWSRATCTTPTATTATTVER
jgi:hypothetical protein